MSMMSNAILVHGAWFALGQSDPAARREGDDGHRVQLPSTGFVADVVAVCRAIALTEGKIRAGRPQRRGAVIGEAGNDPNVARLV